MKQLVGEFLARRARGTTRFFAVEGAETNFAEKETNQFLGEPDGRTDHKTFCGRSDATANELVLNHVMMERNLPTHIRPLKETAFR